MDYANGIVFDSDPSLLEIKGHPLLGIKCYTTTAGRGTAIGSNHIRKQDNSHKYTGIVNSSVAANQTGSYYEMGLSQQIQRASGISYSNQSIENYFCDLSSKQKDLTQFEDIDEGPKSKNADPLGINLPSKSSPQTSTKRKTGKREFRKLDLSPSVSGSTVLNSGGRPAEKKIGDVFKQQQTFDPYALMEETRKNRVHLVSKNDFPSL